ncbi:hypothetical protein [Rhizobium leguminosarum]|uniref:hypothetical protein n=1 Tax=Rhizobium leguminosarum TaxID=384 RepID=UPI001441412F|nr:hypothetical protein [Rhizobium leguminosarum]MBY5863240.1 hypothetical protein [Rhizobium leguminosarum]NKM04120.1 hypothetical protein [Rhizobium leguminosarum bv. viciae]
MIYDGLVVGGPLNGQRLAHGSQSCRVPILSETTDLFYNTAGNRIEETVPYNIFEYDFGPIYIDHNNELNLWTSRGQSRLATLKLLVEGYHPS